MNDHKRRTTKRPLLIVVFCAVIASVALAAPTVKKWLFTTENEMEETARTHADNPRATYYVIMRAHKRGMASQTAVVYHELLQKNPYDPYLQSAFAYSHFMATNIFAREFMNDKSAPFVYKLQKMATEAQYYREEAIKKKPDSPVILLETAQSRFYEPGKSKEAIDLLQRAVKEDPKWADAQYWLGHYLSSYWLQDREHREAIGKESLLHLQEAEKLQPELHPECLIGRVYAYQALDDTAKQVEYLEAYFKARPEALNNEWLVKWQKELHDELAKEK